jgi:hypothetical protein
MGRQMRYITRNTPSNRAVKRSLDCHKTLNRAHLGSCQNDGVSFDGMALYLTALFAITIDHLAF